MEGDTIKINIFVMLLISLLMLSGVASAVSISGYVTSGGVGLSGVSIDANGTATSTNATGYYIATGLAENVTHTVTASKASYVTSTLDVPVTTSDVTNADLTISKTTIGAFLANLIQIVTSLTALVTAIMAVFMEPPLSIFVGLGIFLFILTMINQTIKAKKRR